ncbi:MAG: undecaprenyldiphospho-muramoylpentapeptide beta-N-acetylglucosaminyltransferase [Oscillospiraceae bacterium]|jgi:UDP-N-acetylglucosamine--N-acetylmuramyl-(pentapeptide) pyrophosphoryl-undecaprenol N-acetylglucosamine transferase|nr:undecaprenyldiphospho-muramoylpentapeptide beta-N-acetylglucosaminyltransferase [Oscillospiraceae bacterium]
MNVEKTTYLIAAGGTAGHINPALAVAGIIRYLHPEAKIVFVGTADHMEARLVPAAGFALETIDISGFQRSMRLENIKRNLGTIKRLLRVTGSVGKIFDRVKPDVVVGFGGYVSGPVLRLAYKKGIPTAIHEQNAFPGVTNKTLAKHVDAVMLGAAQAQAHMRCKNPPIVTGIPVRREMFLAQSALCRRELGLDERPMVLSMGGSLGARAMNDAVVGMLGLLTDKKICFHHAYGQYGKWVPEAVAKKGLTIAPPALVLREYIDDMPRCMNAADLVISRAGASAISELQAMGKPSILVPSPNVSENHQYHNAKALADAGAAVLIEEKDLTPQLLAAVVEELISNPEKRSSMAAAAKAMAIADAAERIYDVIVSLLSIVN